MVTTPVRGSQLWADYLHRTVNTHADTPGLDATELARDIASLACVFMCCWWR